MKLVNMFMIKNIDYSSSENKIYFFESTAIVSCHSPESILILELSQITPLAG